MGSFFSTSVVAATDSNAASVKLQTSCTEATVPLNNCFTTISSLLSWITGTRIPTQAVPLKVDIGPGKFINDFDGAVTLGDISFRGSGRDITIISNPSVGLTFKDGSRLHFSDMTVTGGFPAPVYWLGSGSSTWVNVRLKGGLYGWTESGCHAVTSTTKPIHRWFSSSFESAGKVAYAAQCSENWFYGSEFITRGSGFVGGLRGITARASYATDQPEIHVYGSVIRLLPGPGATFPKPTAAGDAEGIVAVAAGKNASIHVHGTGIDIIANDQPNDIAAIAAVTGGSVHADGSAYNLNTAPNGTIYRVKNEGGHIHAPHAWSVQSSPPNVVSATGADTAVVNRTGIGDGHPHLVISDSRCASGWFDSATNTCW